MTNDERRRLTNVRQTYGCGVYKLFSSDVAFLLGLIDAQERRIADFEEIAAEAPPDVPADGWVIGADGIARHPSGRAITFNREAGWWELLPDTPATAHEWRRPEKPEPIEEGGVCVRCGAYAESEAHLPCDPARLETPVKHLALGCGVACGFGAYGLSRSLVAAEVTCIDCKERIAAGAAVAAAVAAGESLLWSGLSHFAGAETEGPASAPAPAECTCRTLLHGHEPGCPLAATAHR